MDWRPFQGVFLPEATRSPGKAPAPLQTLSRLKWLLKMNDELMFLIIFAVLSLSTSNFPFDYLPSLYLSFPFNELAC